MTREMGSPDMPSGNASHDWTHYWRSAEQPIEAMHAHFRRHIYHRHSHDSYSFGVTDDGAQAFRCRGGSHTSAAGMVMAFNPEDPHDGQAATDSGFTYRMLHIGPNLIADVLTDAAGRPCPLPLFAEPVVDDPELASAIRDLHAALVDGTSPLRRDELLSAAVISLVRRAATSTPRQVSRLTATPSERHIAERVRELLHDSYNRDVTGQDLAEAAECGRFAVYRAFQATYGLAPSDYQRQHRLRMASTLLVRDHSLADTAARTRFADQSHLTRWFTRYFGITPAAYRSAVAGS